MKRLAAVTLAAMLTTATTADAAGHYWTGNDLHGFCQVNKHFILGYVTAVVESELEQKSPMVCLPDGVDGGQLVDLLCKQIDENPKDRHNAAFRLTIIALSEAYPCVR